jgi:hypothetical protein
VNDSFQPAWLRVAVVLVMVAGIVAAVWLFAALASSGG